MPSRSWVRSVRWPLLAGVLLGLIAWLVLHRVDRQPAPPTGPAEPVDLVLRAEPGAYLLTERLPADAQPPTGADCARADAWARERGGLHFRSGRWQLTMTARRLAQVEIHRISVRVVRAEPSAPSHWYFTCDDPTRLTGHPPQETVSVPGHADIPLPVFAVGAATDAEPDWRRLGGDGLKLGAHRINLLPDEVFALPLEFEASDSNTTYRFEVDVELRVNGVEVRRTLGDDGRPIGVAWALLARGPGDYEWRPGRNPPLVRLSDRA